MKKLFAFICVCFFVLEMICTILISNSVTDKLNGTHDEIIHYNVDENLNIIDFYYNTYRVSVGSITQEDILYCPVYCFTDCFEDSSANDFKIGTIYESGETIFDHTFSCRSRILYVDSNKVYFENLDDTSVSIIMENKPNFDEIDAEITICSIPIEIECITLNYLESEAKYELKINIKNDGLLTSYLTAYVKFSSQKTIESKYIYLPKEYVYFTSEDQAFVLKMFNINNEKYYKFVSIDIIESGEYYIVSGDINDGNIIISSQ